MFGNVKRTVEIKVEDQGCYHVSVERRVVDPRDPGHPIIKKKMLILRPIDYKMLFGGNAERQAHYLKVNGFENAELIHDPTIERIEKIEIPMSPEEEFRKARVLNDLNKMKPGRPRKS